MNKMMEMIHYTHKKTIEERISPLTPLSAIRITASIA